MALSPQAIAEKGEKIYTDRYKTEYEKKYPGQFVAIEIDSGEAFRATTPEEAITMAQEARDGGFFHLIKVGSPGVYRVSYNNVWRDWLS